MPSVSSIRLFEAEPDLARYLSPEDRAQAAQIRLPAIELAPGQVSVRAELRRRGAFGALVLQGMVLQTIRIGQHSGLRLLGPGDIISFAETAPSMLVLDEDCRATVSTRLALLGREMLVAGRRWPWLVAGLHTRMAEQVDRLTTQLIVCQLPRVDDRLLAMLWLLAESWGQVTASGTVVPIELTHSALGGLIGARRPTVTLALSELTERGAIMRQADGWLLLEKPQMPDEAPGDAVGTPRPLVARPPAWAVDAATKEAQAWAESELTHQQLRETVARLRIEHESRTEQMRSRLAELRKTRRSVSQRRGRRPSGRA